MELVLGVSMTPTTVRMVLVEGENADGVMVDHHVFPITASDAAAPSNASDQVMDAVLATRQCALAAGHHLASTGVTSSDHAEAAALRQALTACGIDDVPVFSGLDAASALARAVGSAVGYGTGALMFIERDTATLSVVQTIDGSVAKVLGRSLHTPDAMAVLTEMVNGLETHEPRPEAMSVVASGVDVGAVKSHLENRVSLPVSAPEEPELALALGAAALAAANAPRLDAPTCGLACSREPAGAMTAAAAYPVALAGPSQLAPAGHDGASLDVAADIVPGLYNPVAGHRPFLSAGSSVTATFAVGVLALVISFAVQLTADQRLSPGPSTAAPAPLAARPAPEAVPAPAPPGPPPVVPAVGPPLTALQTSRSATALYKVPPPSAMPPHAPAPVAPPAAPAPVGIPPAILPAPWLLPIPPPPHYQPPVFGPWYPVPRQPQPPRPQHGHGHHGRGGGGD